MSYNDRIIFIMEMDCVLCEIRKAFVYINRMAFMIQIDKYLFS